MKHEFFRLSVLTELFLAFVAIEIKILHQEQLLFYD